jgi:hypothetical protein
VPQTNGTYGLVQAFNPQVAQVYFVLLEAVRKGLESHSSLLRLRWLLMPEALASLNEKQIGMLMPNHAHGLLAALCHKQGRPPHIFLLSLSPMKKDVWGKARAPLGLLTEVVPPCLAHPDEWCFTTAALV